jgi:cyclophilin family peptidyl-prolyl cis-trans isomerase
MSSFRLQDQVICVTCCCASSGIGAAIAAALENKDRFEDLRRSRGVAIQLTVSLDYEQYLEVEKAEEGLFRRLDELECWHIQKTSAKLTMEKYGPEPYRVKMNLADLGGTTNSIVLELAPLSEMPHAVYYFLQMVEQNLWDELAMMLNGGTTVDSPNHWMTTPMKMDFRLGQHSWEGGRFQSANLTHMAFTEHSTSYPSPDHFQYSVAFSGHPGGPNFYIRMDNNSTEDHVKNVHQQPSTFAVVVEGTDTLDRYLERNEAPNKKTRKLQVLTIRSMELLRSEAETKLE